MAYELVEDVLDHSPPGLGATEILVLTVIAEQARRASREASIPQDLFLRRCRVTESGLRKVFRRLKEAGLDVRIPLYVKSDGRIMYAIPGSLPKYYLPPLNAPKNCPCHRCKKAGPQDLLQTEEVPQGGSTGLEGGSTGLEGGTTSPQDPLSVPEPPPGASGTVEGVGAQRGKRDAEAGPFDREALILQLSAAREKWKTPKKYGAGIEDRFGRPS